MLTSEGKICSLGRSITSIVTILDWPGNDPSHVRVLESTSVLGPNADRVVVKLSFIDVNHSGKPDMLITMDGEPSELVNDGSTFRLPTPAEQQQLQRYLQQHS